MSGIQVCELCEDAFVGNPLDHKCEPSKPQVHNMDCPPDCIEESEPPTVSEDKTDNSPYIDDKLVNEWMLKQGFFWFDHPSGGYWNIEHFNGTHESVTQIVARRFYALIHRVERDARRSENKLAFSFWNKAQSSVELMGMLMERKATLQDTAKGDSK